MPTVTLTATADTYVDSARPNEVVGWSDHLIRVGRFFQGTTLGTLIGFAQFNFSTIPAGSKITSATLKLMYEDWDGDAANTYANIKPLKMTGTIGSSTTWNNRPNTVDVGSPTVKIDRNINDSTIISFNITAMFADISNMRGVALTMASGGPGAATTENRHEFRSLEDDFILPKVVPKIDVTYTSAPTKPTVTAPNGGESWIDVHTISWTAATDPSVAQSALTYEVWLTTNNRTTWKKLFMTTAGVVSQSYNFGPEAQTSQARIRVRAWNGSAFGDYDESNGVFTIVHNTQPTSPTNLVPSSGTKDRTAIIQFTWTHNDPQSDPQAKFDFQWRTQGSLTWNTISQTTANQFYNMPANTITVDGVIEWQVRTYDSGTSPGPYSALAAVQIGAKPAAPVIISPATSTVNEARPLIEWTTLEQVSYQILIKNAAGTTTLYDSLEVPSTNRAVTLGFDLVDGTSYKLSVLVKSAGGIWSNATTMDITVDFTPPPMPMFMAELEAVRGSIMIMVENPAPTGSEPMLTFNDIFRRLPGGEWAMIATGVPENGMFHDYTPASGQNYDYYVRANGMNGTYMDSDVAQIMAMVNNTQIALTSDYEQWAEMVKGTKLNQMFSVDSAEMLFTGREYPVIEFGVNSRNSFAVSYMVFGYTEVEKIKMLVEMRDTLLLRDSKGLVEFVYIDTVDVDETPTHWIIKINPVKVSNMDAGAGHSHAGHEMGGM